MVSKEKQLHSLQSQVKVLNSTVGLLHEQIDNTKQANERVNETLENERQKGRQKEREIERLTKRVDQYEKDLVDYYDIIPRLNELEEI
jgi:chromosome segregation ATPase